VAEGELAVKINLTIKESEAEINRRVIKSLSKSLNEAAMKALPEIVSKIKVAVVNRIKSSDEYAELQGGTLQAQLGVPNSNSRLERITDIWISNISIKRKPIRAMGSNRITGGFSIGMIKKDWSDVLATSDANYTTEKGRKIPWLEWLLIAGDKTIIDDYTFTPDIPPKARSRTGLGIMKANLRRRWGVPSQYAGTTQNNFVTRSLEGIDKEIIAIMQSEISRKMK